MKGVVVMLKVLNFLGISALVFSIYTGCVLFNTNLPKDANKVKRMEVKEEKKIETPPPSPKSFDQKLLSKYAMIDSSDVVLESHINSVLDKNRYGCMGKDRYEYVTSISSSILNYTHGDLKMALWVAAMAQIESSYRLSADPKVSSAKGFLQVIFRYHKKELLKVGINEYDLNTDPVKSIRAGILVFSKYLKIEHGDFRLATDRYRGLSVPKKERDRYYNLIHAVYSKLLKEVQEYA